MIKPFIDAVERFITDFSGRRLAIWFGVVVLGVLLFAGYESYTDQFETGRISEQVKLLADLQEMRQHPAMEHDSVLVAIYEGLRTQLAESVESPSLIPDLPQRWTQALAGFAPWFLLMVLMLTVPGMRPDDNVGTAAVALVFVGAVVGGVGYAVPPAWPGVVTWLVVPVGSVMLVMMWTNARSQARQAESPA